MHSRPVHWPVTKVSGSNQRHVSTVKDDVANRLTVVYSILIFETSVKGI